MKKSAVILGVLCALAVVLAAAGCKQASGGEPVPDVYVAGFSINAQGAKVATVWKNGVATELESGTEATSIWVAGTDMYVAGKISTNAAYWVNGVKTDLTDWSKATGICAANGKVYVVGTKGGKAVIHDGSTDTELPSGTDATAIHVSGTDVYVAGNGMNGDPNPASTARVWKNGILLYEQTMLSRANAVFASGDKVYSGGAEGDSSPIEMLWVNNVKDSYTNMESEINSIYVTGGDVYAAGYEKNGTNISVAKVWKNGIINPTIHPTDGIMDTVATSVYVSGGDVYAAGRQNSAGMLAAKVWKNKTLILDKTNAGANSIFVK